MPKKVLIIDDSAVTCSLLSERVESGGYVVMVANSAEQGLEIMRKQLPDLVLLDVYMPRMDGFEVCRRAKSDPLIKDIPVVFVTTAGQKEDLAKGKEAGGNGYITKPYDGKLFLEEVKRLIG